MTTVIERPDKRQERREERARQKELHRQLRRQGNSYRAIAEITGFDPATVYSHAKDVGISTVEGLDGKVRPATQKFSQQRAAQKLAVQSKKRNSLLKKDVAALETKEGRFLVADVVETKAEYHGGLAIEDLLASINQWGPWKVVKFLGKVKTHPQQRLRELSETQKEAIVAKLRGSIGE